MRSHALGIHQATGIFALLTVSGFLQATSAEAGCGCTKPPPPPAAVRPAVAYPGVPITLFGSGIEGGRVYQVTFTPASSGVGVTIPAFGVVPRDLADAVSKPMIVTLLPTLALGPAAIQVRDVASGAEVLSVTDDAFTVAPSPVALPTDYGTRDWPGYRAAVSRGGTVYMTLDVSAVQLPMVFDAQAVGYPLRFTADDVLFYNTQGFLMQRLLTDGIEPIPGMSVVAATNPADGDRLHYSRHEFASYFLQHQEQQPHWVDPTNPNWHLDGTRHIDHNVLVVALMGGLGSGAMPAPGATPSFTLHLTTQSLFYQGLVGTHSITSNRDVWVDSFRRASTSGTTGGGLSAMADFEGMLLAAPTTDGEVLDDVTTSAGTTASGELTYGSEGDLFTNGTVSLGAGTIVNGKVTAASIKKARGVVVTGAQVTLTQPASFLDVMVPGGLPDLGAMSVLSGTSQSIVGPGSFKLSTLYVDNSRGPVTLYVKGGVTVATDARVVTADQDPEKLAIYVASTQPVSLGADSPFYGVVYAPYSALSISGAGEFFGAFLGSTVDLGSNTMVHYNADLRGQ